MANYIPAKDKGELAARMAALRDRAYREATASGDLSEYFDLTEVVAILEVRHEHEVRTESAYRAAMQDLERVRK